MAALFDLRYKKLNFIDLDNKRNEIIQKLYDEFTELKSNNPNKPTQAAGPSNQSVPFLDLEYSLHLQK